MAIDQFQVTRNPFQPANTTQTTTGTSSTGSSGTSQSLPADINPYNVNVVNELMRRGRADVAAEKYPYEYKAMFGEQAAPTNKVKIHNAATEKESDLEIDPTLAHKYNTTAWGGGQPRYNSAVMNNYKLDEELGNKITQRVDYNQIGGINGSKTKDGYKFFDKEALLPSLFYKRLGLLPEQVLALNHFDREEIARKLLTEYYNATDDGERSQFGDLEGWTDYVLKHYGFDLGSQADDSGWTTLKQTAGRMWDGAVDQVDNWIDGAKALVSGFDADEAEKARIKARQAEHEKNKTAAERAITQRLDSLMADDRWEDALWFAVSNSEAWSALMGSSMGSMVADALATTGLIWTGSALAAPFTAGGSVAAGAAGTAANVSRLAMKLRSMAKAGTFGAVSSLGMVGQEAKELVLDGKTIPEGSELHNQLRLYGLLNIPLMMLPGSMETAIAKIIASKTGTAAAQELAPTLAARIRDALVKKGYTFTENGVKRSIRGKAVEWGVTPAYKVGVEAGQEWVQGAYGDALKQGSDKDGNFDWDKVSTAKAFDNTKMEALGGAMFGIANAGGGAAKAKLGRGREVALGRTAHNFDQYTASLDQDTIDQINADIAAGKYRLDGTERQEGDPMPTPEDAERIRTAVLWRKFQTGDRQDTTADVDEDVDTDVNDDPIDDTNPLQPSQEERNAAYAKKKTDRWARTQEYIVNQEGLKDFYANASAVKDIRGLSTEDVDSHWTEVQSALSTVAKNERKKLDKLKKAVDDAQDLVDKTDGHPNQHIYIDKLTEAQNAYNEAANAVVGIETALLRAKTSQDVAAIIDTYGNRLSGKTAQKAAQIRSLADLAAQYGTVRDNATRWNVNERQQVTDIANQIAQEAGITDFTMDPTNLSAGLNDLSAKLRSHNLADSARYQRYIEKAKVLSVMVKANRPEMLANWGKIDGHVKKKPGIRNALWQGKDNQFAWARSDVKKAIKTATVNKANVFTAEDLKAFDDIMDDLYESHPIDAFDQIIAKMQTAFNNRISESDNVQNIDERRAMLGAIQRVRYVRALVAGGSGQTATAKPSNRYGQVQLGRKVYDDLAALMHFEEVNRYAVDVAAIAEAYGVKDLGKTFEADMAGYIGLLRSAVRTQYQMKNHTNANNKYVVTDILRTKDGILNRGNELGATVDEYLKGVQTRLEQLRAGYFADPAPEITAYPYGDLLNAVLEDQRSPANKAVFNWVKDQFRKRNEAAPDVNDGNIDDVLDDILKKKAGTPVSEPPPSTPKGEQLIADLGEPESGYFRITENGPFVLSSQSAMNILNTAMANGSSPEDVSKFVAEQLADIAANRPDALPPEVAKAISAHFSDMAALQTWMEANRLNQNIKADVNAEYVGALNNLILQNVLRSEDTWMGDTLGSLFGAIAKNIGVTIKGDHNGLVANMVKQFVASGGMNDYAIYVVDGSVDHGGVVVTDGKIEIDINHPDVGGLLTKGIVQAATRKRVEDGIRSAKQTALVGDPVGERLTKRVDTLVKRFADGKNDQMAEELIKLGVLNPERNGLTADGEVVLLKQGMMSWVWYANDPQSVAVRFALKDLIGPKNVGSIDGVYVAAANLVANETKHTRQNMLFGDDYASPVYTGFGAKPGKGKDTSKSTTPKKDQFTKDNAKPTTQKKQSYRARIYDVVTGLLRQHGIDIDGIAVTDNKIPKGDRRSFGGYDPMTGQITAKTYKDRQDLGDDWYRHVAAHEVGHRASNKLVSQVGMETYEKAIHKLAENPFIQKLRNSRMIRDNYTHRKKDDGSVGHAYAAFDYYYKGWSEILTIEECLVDLYAARITGDWETFVTRYDLGNVNNIPAELRAPRLPSIIRDFISAITGYINSLIGKNEVKDSDVAEYLNNLVKIDQSVRGDDYVKDGAAKYVNAKINPGAVSAVEFSANPNPDNKKDRTTVYTFGYHPDNQYVTDNPTAWWDGAGWNFFYFDAQGNPQRITGMTARDVMDTAKGMDLFIDQRQKDLILKSHPVNGDAFQQFSVPMAKFWRGVNRVFRGDENNIHPVVRGMMGLVQKIAIEQHGADQFLKMAENVITHVTGTDKEGVLTNLVNRYRSQINHQLTNPGVGGKMTMFDHKEKLYKLLREIGWSQDKVNNTLYAMRAADVQRELTKRQTEDPKWKGKPIDAGHDFTAFSWTDGQGKTQHDPDGTLWMSQLSDADRKIADNLRELVTKLNDSVLQIELESGRISDDYYNTYAGQFYVPLKNETDKATAFQRQSVGRYTKADDPLTHLLANHEARLRAAEQSMIYQAFMDAVEQYGLTGFATFNSSTLRNKGDGEYAMTADGFLEGNSVTFYRKGKKVNMTITHPAMKKALQKRKKEAQSEYLNTVAKLTGFLGLTRTALPTFAKTAFLRDFVLAQANVQAAFRGKENLSTAEWFALGTKTAIRMVKSLPMIAHAKWDNQKGDFAYKVYRSEGGIGNTTAYDIDSVNAALERDVFDHASVKGKAKGYARKYLNALHASDDAARYALWISYLEKKNGGAFASEQDLVNYLKANEDIADNARNASKNITGNFEQRGMSRSIRSHYIFWNAAMAGSRTFYGLLNPRYGTYGLTAMSVLASLIFAAAAGGEDDEDGKNKESRVKNLGNVISIGGFDLGLAQELRPVAHLVQAVAFSADGTWDMKQAMTHILNGVSQAVVPVSPASTGDAQTDLLYAMTPTVLQPLVLQNAGKTYFGGDLAPAPYDTDGNQWRDAPDYLRAQSGSSGLATGAAEWLHSITGGNVDVAPGSIDMWMQQVFGSVFSQAKDIAKRVNKGENYAEAVFNQFAKSHNHEYNEFALKEEVTDRFKRAFENNRIGEDGQILGKTQFTAAYTELKALESAMSKELKQYVGDNGAKITDLYTQLNNVKNSSSYSPDEFYRLTSQIERIRGERNAVYGKYNRILMEMGY